MTITSNMKQRFLDALFLIGRSLGEESTHRVAVAHTFLELGAWSKTNGDLPVDLPSKESLFALAVRSLAVDDNLLYLEFGVFRGHTLRWWSTHLPGAHSALVGFDSFEGLPENWNRYFAKGQFATEGTPDIDDRRVSYEVGWFDDTVPSFVLPTHDQLIVNVDSDLYSSAVIVLNKLEQYLVPGSLIYFDEFADRDHELRAFREFLGRSNKTVSALGTSNNRNCWLFRVES